MSNIIVFGSIGFFIAVLLFGGLILWALDKALSSSEDSGGGFLATVFVIGFIVAYYFLGSQQDVRDAFSYVTSNPSVILAWFGGYLGLGVIWGFIKWYFFLHKQIDKELARLKDGITEYTSVHAPSARDNRWRIMSWMMYWPFSAFWTAIDQPFKYAFGYIFSKVEGWFDKISNAMYKDVNAKFAAEKEKFRLKGNKAS